jgi:hypothetical protein
MTGRNNFYLLIVQKTASRKLNENEQRSTIMLKIIRLFAFSWRVFPRIRQCAWFPRVSRVLSINKCKQIYKYRTITLLLCRCFFFIFTASSRYKSAKIYFTMVVNKKRGMLFCLMRKRKKNVTFSMYN